MNWSIKREVSVGHIVTVVIVLISLILAWSGFGHDIQTNAKEIGRLTQDLKEEVHKIQNNHDQFVTRNELQLILSRIDDLAAEVRRVHEQ